MAKQKETQPELGVVASGKLNEILYVETIRPDGSRRIQQDFSFCPSMAEQHTSHLSDLNYLMEKYKPDELAAYIAARQAHRQEIIGHDFSQEPDLQESKNVIYRSKKAFEALPDDVKTHFSSHLEFLKFMDNPQNIEKMLKLGLLTEKQIEQIQVIPPPPPKTNDDIKLKPNDDKKT